MAWQHGHGAGRKEPSKHRAVHTDCLNRGAAAMLSDSTNAQVFLDAGTESATGLCVWAAAPKFKVSSQQLGA